MNVTGNKSNASNIRQQVFAELDKNPLLTAQTLAKIIELSPIEYQRLKGYLRKLKCDWKRYHEKERGLIRSCPDDVHNAFFVGKLNLDIGKFNLVSGWVRTKSRNRFFLWKDNLGRIRWFESGTVELYVRKPASLGKAMQLFCNAFTWTKIVTDLAVIDEFQRGLKIRGFHAVFNTPERLPYLKVKLFKGSNGVELLLGDRTHPNGVELIVNYLDQVEQAKSLIENLTKAFGLASSSGIEGVSRLKPERDYSM
jgi:hypothetical protein